MPYAWRVMDLALCLPHASDWMDLRRLQGGSGGRAGLPIPSQTTEIDWMCIPTRPEVKIARH
jgi:hypothetical protein